MRYRKYNNKEMFLPFNQLIYNYFEVEIYSNLKIHSEVYILNIFYSIDDEEGGNISRILSTICLKMCSPNNPNIYSNHQTAISFITQACITLIDWRLVLLGT